MHVQPQMGIMGASARNIRPKPNGTPIARNWPTELYTLMLIGQASLTSEGDRGKNSRFANMSAMCFANGLGPKTTSRLPPQPARLTVWMTWNAVCQMRIEWKRDTIKKKLEDPWISISPRRLEFISLNMCHINEKTWIWQLEF